MKNHNFLEYYSKKQKYNPNIPRETKYKFFIPQDQPLKKNQNKQDIEVLETLTYVPQDPIMDDKSNYLPLQLPHPHP